MTNPPDAVPSPTAPAAPSAALTEAARTALRRLVGRDDADFRDGQLEAISALVADRSRVLVVQRTGWGKSAVYFVSTALRRAEGAGPTVIISPLLALMRDQIAAAERAGIRAVTMNSANAQDWDEDDGDRLELALQVGGGAFLDGLRDLLHLRRAFVLGHHQLGEEQSDCDGNEGGEGGEQQNCPLASLEG